MNKVFILFIFFAITVCGCSKKTADTDIIASKTSTDISIEGNTATTNTAEITYASRPDGGILYVLQEDEGKDAFFGTFYITTINDDNVNVRSLPTTKAEVLFQLNKDDKIDIIGVSSERQTIDNYTGNWCNIRRVDSWQSGWVFSKYVESGNITPNEIHLIGMLAPEKGRAQGAVGTYKIGDIEYHFVIYPHKETNQSFYTFVWDIDDDKFHYSNPPGTYAWYPDTNELKHLTYIGTGGESAWVVLTDDFEYTFEDFGTSTGPRALGVWRTDDGREVFSGSHYGSVNMRGHTIEVVYPFHSWSDISKYNDEIIKYADEFKQQNPGPFYNENGRELTLLLITCDLDLDTGTKKIIGAKYIYEQ
jgi:hypothetical protein